MNDTTYALNVWHMAKRGTANIHLEESGTKLVQRYGSDELAEVTTVNPGGKRYAVTALDGHELLPCTRSFDDLAEAKAYANELWERY